MKTLKGGLSLVTSEDWKEVIEGAVQGCYRVNTVITGAVHALCENAPPQKLNSVVPFTAPSPQNFNGDGTVNFRVIHRKGRVQ